MSRSLALLLALVALTCAFSGIWFGGLRNERAIHQALAGFPRPNDTPFFRCADSFYWVSYAREMMEQGTVRLRFTKMDNAPYGRPNYGWAALNAWYLIALAWLWSMMTGLTTSAALSPAALWAGPILYFAALLILLALGYSGNFTASL
jgi:hypothetical protein